MKILLSLILLGQSVSANAYVAPPCAAKNNMASMKLGGDQDNAKSPARTTKRAASQGLSRP